VRNSDIEKSLTRKHLVYLHRVRMQKNGKPTNYIIKRLEASSTKRERCPLLKEFPERGTCSLFLPSGWGKPRPEQEEGGNGGGPIYGDAKDDTGGRRGGFRISL